MTLSTRKPRKPSLLYAFFRPWVAASSRMFFRRIHLEGTKHIPPDSAKFIMVANHQNGMMDPVMLCTWFPRQLHFLTRADIFQKPLANKIFRSFNMLPVFRERDRVEDISGRNAEIFNECAARLAEGHVIALFPEGTHGNKKHLRPLKKGVARLAFSAAEEYPDLERLMILPAAVDYSDFFDYRSELTVRIGCPIDLKPFLDIFRQDAPGATKLLMAEVRSQLEKCMVHYESPDWYATGRACFQLARTETGQDNEREFASAFNNRIRTMNPEESEGFRQLVSDYRTVCRKLKLSEASFQQTPSLAKRIWLGLSAPVALLAVLLHLLPYWFIERTIRKSVRDEHFISSARLVLTTFGFPMWWFILASTTAVITKNGFMLPIGILALFLSAEITLHAGDIYRDWRQVMRKKKLERCSKLSSVNEQRKQILSKLFN
jgi:1-acyl-sn-glycerol-3-phosphate acyltransferase